MYSLKMNFYQRMSDMGGRADDREEYDGIDRRRRSTDGDGPSIDLLIYKIDETQKIVTKMVDKVDGVILSHTKMQVEMETKAKAEGKTSGAIWGFISATVITVLSVSLEKLLGGK